MSLTLVRTENRFLNLSPDERAEAYLSYVKAERENRLTPNMRADYIQVLEALIPLASSPSHADLFRDKIKRLQSQD
jgi:hypothetical protein